MKPSVKTFLLALIIALLLSCASTTTTTARACTCGPISACQAYADASVVFVGLVTDTAVVSAESRLPSNAVSTTLTGGTAGARFKVEEAFRGVAGAELEVYGGGSTCDYHFKQGERYLVYASQEEGGTTLYTNLCSGTAPLSKSQAGLDYLRHATKMASGGAVFGEIYRELSRSDKKGLTAEPIAKAVLILENGKQRFQVVSDANGKFELQGLAPGRYKAHTNPPTNYSRFDVMAEEPRGEWELDVPEHGCLKAWFAARPSGEISGTVTDDTGIVAADVEPELIPVDEKLAEYNFWSTRLGELSSFKFTFLPPGRYYLGFNMKSGPSVSQPYPEFYYPGVTERAKATIITLGEGQKVSDLYLPRPLRLAERMIEGVAVWPDGRPFVENCGIQLTNPRTDYREGNCVSTDAQGRFKIKAIEGQTYELSATITSGKSIGLISSRPVIVKVGKENSPVRLVVQAP